MDQARVIKTPYEIAAIRKANAISSAAHAAVADLFSGMVSERDVEATFLRECIRRGAKNQAYPVIAGAGENAATLHYESNNQPLEGKQLMVLDAGCEFKCYASDITRTLPIGGAWPSQEAKDIYAVVKSMQSTAISMIEPGIVYYKLHVEAHRVAAEGLLKLGIVKAVGASEGSMEERVNEVLESGITGAFFPHGLGHHIGLETHDVSGKERLLAVRDESHLAFTLSSGSGRRKRTLVSPEELVEMVSSARNVPDAPDQRDGRLEPVVDEPSCRRKESFNAPGALRSGSAPASSASPPPKAEKQKLQAGMVVTIEPGM